MADLYRGEFDKDFCPSTTANNAIITGWFDAVITDEVTVRGNASVSKLKALYDRDFYPLLTAKDGYLGNWFSPETLLFSLESATGSLTPTTAASFIVSGLGATATVGTVSITVTTFEAPSGFSLQAAVGTVSITTAVVFTLTGVSASVLTHAVSVTTAVSLTVSGLSLVATVGDVTVTTSGGGTTPGGYARNFLNYSQFISPVRH